MQADPLQQLRDVHSPIDPAWWPPAPGWWVIAVVLLAGLAWLIWKGWQTWRKRAPVRAAAREHKLYQSALAAGELSEEDYLHQCNELLKRVLVRGYRRYEYAALSGHAWLQALDDLSESKQFSEGPGQALGNDRFSRQPKPCAEQLSPVIERVIHATVKVA